MARNKNSGVQKLAIVMYPVTVNTTELLEGIRSIKTFERSVFLLGCDEERDQLEHRRTMNHRYVRYLFVNTISVLRLIYEEMRGISAK